MGRIWLLGDLLSTALSSRSRTLHNGMCKVTIPIIKERYVTLKWSRVGDVARFSGDFEHISGMRVFSFLTDFRFFLCPRTIFIIDQNAPKCSKWVFLFEIFLGICHCKIFSVFFIAIHSHAWYFVVNASDAKLFSHVIIWNSHGQKWVMETTPSLFVVRRGRHCVVSVTASQQWSIPFETHFLAS